jgi:hypothetical protein
VVLDNKMISGHRFGLLMSAFSTREKKVRSYDVNTCLDFPDDVVTLKVVFDSLPDGTNYSAQTVLDATAKQVQIRTTGSATRSCNPLNETEAVGPRHPRRCWKTK